MTIYMYKCSNRTFDLATDYRISSDISDLYAAYYCTSRDYLSDFI